MGHGDAVHLTAIISGPPPLIILLFNAGSAAPLDVVVMQGLEMNGYLLMVRMNMDDLPLRWFNNLAEAKEFVSERIEDGNPTKVFEELLESVAVAIDFQLSDLVSCKVLRVINGWPTEVVHSEVFA